MSQTDKTGAPTTVAAKDGRFTISVDGKEVGKAEFLTRDGRRVFTHTEVDNDYEGRGLGTILIREALEQTRDAGIPIVAKCPMVANYISKHDEFKDAVES
ncbi:GNAT family N-acetyltransferase [Mycobacterium sp. 1274761.0]|uniref:GNAT family N-acetyltransferase n=1 Tax=Mycobacterium sp. 1274761.0 TaxID=1834077 RepID=UPI0007FD96B9|nr:GNAT family N-acetyltransferase [Mycobacterium sp. 1274761.0]OBK71291.1 acetyltransferase [Mycobacterium sp. 1274761.0]